MSLDVGADHLFVEWREATERNQRFLGSDYDDEVRGYATSGYRQDWREDENNKENFHYEWFSVFAPQFLSGVPRVKTRTRRQGPSGELAKALQHALNRSIKDTDFWSTMEKCFYDFGFRWAVAITSPEPLAGAKDFADPPYRPVSKRLSPKHYRHDPKAMEASEDRWRGHLYIRDREAVQEEAGEHPELGWNLDLITAMGEDINFEFTGREENSASQVKRHEIIIAEIWVPEHQLDTAKDSKGKDFTPKPENGFHGTIFTIPIMPSGGETEGIGDDDYLRPPRPFWGPREGPYTVGGAFIVPDSPDPLSPLAAIAPQIEELNMHRDSTSESMKNYKKGLAVDSAAGDDLGPTIRDFHDQAVFKLENVDELDKHMKEIELWGITPQHIAHLSLLKESLRTLGGIDEAGAGNAIGDVTATATSIANQSAARRASYLFQKFVMFGEACLRVQAWYLDRDERMVVPLGQDAAAILTDPETGQPVVEPVFQGGGVPLEDHEIEVDVYSIQHTSEQIEMMRNQEEQMIMTTIIPALPTIALFYDVEGWAERQGERLGDPNFAKRINMETLMQIAVIQLQGMVEPTQSTQAPQPRLAKDIMPASKRPEGYSGNARTGASNNSNTQTELGKMKAANA